MSRRRVQVQAMLEDFELRRTRAQLARLARMSRQVLLLSALAGALTGGAVHLFEQAVHHVGEWVLHLPWWLSAGAPLVGLTLTALILRHLAGGASPATADDYIRNFHDPADLDLRPLPGRVLAAVATLGSGGAMGMEGPSLYLGAGIGTWLKRRFPRLFDEAAPKLLMVAGAAAGVAAIFGAPATGAVFALEVPYRDDLSRRRLLPALIGASTGYLVPTLIRRDAEPLFNVSLLDFPAINLSELGVALALGVAAGIFTRIFAALIQWAKALSLSHAAWKRVLIGGMVLAGAAAVSHLLTDQPLSLGPGYPVFHWAIAPERTAMVVAGMLLVRSVATVATVGAGGVGGLFIPLVVAGGLLGRLAAAILDVRGSLEYTVIGIAAVLGAGYRVPLAAITFVAETTGRPGYIVPGVLAAVAADLFMGSRSVTPYQHGTHMIARLGGADD